ncbi:hypothetical protein [Pseudomonas japonica]|uniref:Lipoprotein n=1 Tax=Pseudomonas japonica TaxID=256466 RepID=A0A239KXS5_9PSED|nr:hypothetical protein [Pseudomonas japonica]SNT23167.1 hypothetical protein SAMN05444352_13033 [Pseudomonas japonica]
MRKWSAVLITLAIAGCGEKVPEQSQSSASVFTVETKDDLVRKALPATRLACPGLDRYASQFDNVRVEKHFRTSIVFHIPEDSTVPESYKAGGQNCFVEIEDDRSAIVVEKLACKSVCLDKLNVPDGQLKLELASDDEVKRRECLTSYDYDPATKTTFELPQPAHCAKSSTGTNNG